MNPNSDGWLRRQAALETNETVSVADLIFEIEDLERKRSQIDASRVAFVWLLDLARRERGLTWEQFGQMSDVDLGELYSIVRRDQEYTPTRTSVIKLAQFIGVPAEKMYTLSGIKHTEDRPFQRAALQFVARSQPVDPLTSAQREALQEYIKFLCEE